MVIITNANGDVVKNIPENIYQGSNNANSIVVLAPFASSSQLTIAYRLPDGVLTEPALMTPYEDVPSEYDLSGWYINLDEAITEKYGNVDFQVRATTNSDTVVASFGFNFTVLRGVAPILPPTPSQSIYEQILTALASTQADIVNGWLESKGNLPYDETFTYSLNTVLYSNNTFYKSKIPDNVGNPLIDTDSWEEIPFATEQEVADLIQAHNISETAHNDIRLILTGLIEGTYPIDSCANVSETINDINITDIFESNGITAKSATNAKNDALGNDIVETYQTKANLLTSYGIIPTTHEKYPSAKLVLDTIYELINGVIQYKGVWVTSGQTNYSQLNAFVPIKKGWRFECVGTGCTIDGVEYLAGDYITFNTDVNDFPITTSMIDKTDNTDLVASVNGKKGTVVLDGADINATIEINGVESTETITQHLQNLEDNIEEDGVVWDGSIASSFAGGTGTEEDPYLISNGSELAYLAYTCNNGTNETFNKYYKIINNIYLNKNAELYKTWDTVPPENTWVAIGGTDTGKEFQGFFDGTEHFISGIYINNVTYAHGLFGTALEAKIKNVGVINSYIEANSMVGGIVGWFKATVSPAPSYVENCYNSGIVTCIGHYGTTGGIGGIVGQASAYYAVVNRCYNNGNISGTSFIGGIVGQLSSNTKILNCFNKGIIFSSSSNTGGILGQNSQGEVLNCNNYGFVSGNSSIGGIVGDNDYYADIKNCYNIGTVTCSGSYCGSIAGKNLANCTISNCYYADGTDIVGLNGGTLLNNSAFVLNTQVLTTSVFIGSLNIYSTLIDALNAWVEFNQTSDTTYLTWVKQSGAVGDRLPILTTNDTWVDLDKIEEEIATKEPLLPATPESPDTKFLNGNKEWSAIASSDLTDSANLIKGDTVYGGTIIDNLNTIEKSGFYTCYGIATGAPTSTYSWFILHENSNVGTVSATQKAVAYDSTDIKMVVRVKTNSTWGAWVKITTEKDTQTYTTTLPTTSGGASDWQAVTGGYELAKTISGLTVYDSIVSVASDDTIWTENELNATITTDTLTFFVSSLPSAEVELTLTVTKSTNGGTL